jgi:hypothetical protein
LFRLGRYLDGQTFRFNEREDTDATREWCYRRLPGNG